MYLSSKSLKVVLNKVGIYLFVNEAKGLLAPKILIKDCDNTTI